MVKWLKEFLIGFVLLAIVVLICFFTKDVSYLNFGLAAYEFAKGGLIWIMLLIGVLYIMLGIVDFRERKTNNEVVEVPDYFDGSYMSQDNIAEYY